MFESLKQGSSSAYMLKALIVFSSERGADTGSVLNAINFDTEIMVNEQARIPLSVFNQLWNEIAVVLDDPFLGLHFGEALGKQGEGHFLFVIMKNSETLHKALKSLIRFHNLMTDLVKPSLSIINGKAYMELEFILRDEKITRHLSDAVLSMLATVLRTLTNDEIVIENIYMDHSASDDSDEYARIFGKMPIFKSGKNSIVFDESELYRTFPLAHHEFGTQLKEYAEKLDNQLYLSEKYNDRTLNLLEKYIRSGKDCSLGAVADSFNMSIRQLQNKLKEEGFTYQLLLDKARKDIALHYLQNEDVMLCDIAFLLGFSEQSSFNHAFKKWTGQTPREYKNTITERNGTIFTKK